MKSHLRWDSNQVEMYHSLRGSPPVVSKSYLINIRAITIKICWLNAWYLSTVSHERHLVKVIVIAWRINTNRTFNGLKLKIPDREHGFIKQLLHSTISGWTPRIIVWRHSLCASNAYNLVLAGGDSLLCNNNYDIDFDFITISHFKTWISQTYIAHDISKSKILKVMHKMCANLEKS